MENRDDLANRKYRYHQKPKHKRFILKIKQHIEALLKEDYIENHRNLKKAG